MCTALELEVDRHGGQFVLRIHALHGQPAGIRAAQVTRQVSEIGERGKGPRGDAVKRLLDVERLDAAVDHFKVGQPQFGFHLGQKAGLLAIAVEQGETAGRKHDRQHHAGHAATATNIKPALALDVRQDAQTVEQVAADHLVRVAHRGEVVGLVPLVQQRQVGQQLALLIFGQVDA